MSTIVKYNVLIYVIVFYYQAHPDTDESALSSCSFTTTSLKTTLGTSTTFFLSPIFMFL